MEKRVKSLIMEKKQKRDKKSHLEQESHEGEDLALISAPHRLHQGEVALLSRAGLLCGCFMGSQEHHFSPSAQKKPSHSKRDFHP